jgi:hypothetical protein
MSECALILQSTRERFADGFSAVEKKARQFCPAFEM